MASGELGCDSSTPRRARTTRPGTRAALWPGGPPQQQIHLDLWVDDIEAEHARVVELGAEVLEDDPQPDADSQFRVYADPAGHPFCLCWRTD